MGFLFFWLHLLAPPSAFLLPPPLYYNLSHTTSLTTTSLKQHPTHNVSHTTSLTQHLSQQHLTHNSTHTTSLTQHRMPRGRMYASLLQHLSQQHHSENIPHTTSHTQQHTHNMTCQGVGVQGVGCTPWRRLASAGHRRRFRGRRSTLLLAKRSDVRPGVVWRRLGTGADFVAGAALCCLPRGRMYALASSGVGWAPAQMSWQAQHFAACQGVGCTSSGVIQHTSTHALIHTHGQAHTIKHTPHLHTPTLTHSICLACLFPMLTLQHLMSAASIFRSCSHVGLSGPIIFLSRTICRVITISFKLQACEPKSHLKAYVLCSYNESV